MLETVVQLSRERDQYAAAGELDGSDVDFASLREDATYPLIRLRPGALRSQGDEPPAQTKRKCGLQVGTNHNVSKR